MLRMSLAATRQDLGGPNSPEAYRERGENLEQTSCVREIRRISIGTSNVIFPHQIFVPNQVASKLVFQDMYLVCKAFRHSRSGPMLLCMTTAEALAIHKTAQPRNSKPKLSASMSFCSFPIYRTGVPHRLLVSTRPAVFRSLFLTLT